MQLAMTRLPEKLSAASVVPGLSPASEAAFACAPAQSLRAWQHGELDSRKEVCCLGLTPHADRIQRYWVAEQYARHELPLGIRDNPFGDGGRVDTALPVPQREP
jgi:hypothetical protein